MCGRVGASRRQGRTRRSSGAGAARRTPRAGQERRSTGPGAVTQGRPAQPGRSHRREADRGAIDPVPVGPAIRAAPGCNHRVAPNRARRTRARRTAGGRLRNGWNGRTARPTVDHGHHPGPRHRSPCFSLAAEPWPAEPSVVRCRLSPAAPGLLDDQMGSQIIKLPPASDPGAEGPCGRFVSRSCCARWADQPRPQRRPVRDA